MSRTDASISCSSMGSLLVLMPVRRLGLLFVCRRRAHIQTEHGEALHAVHCTVALSSTA